jgi:DNA end-binding protein Ku
MPQQIWRGSISFGLVNVGVRAFSATRDRSIKFHQIDKESGSRIGYEKVAKSTGEKVDKDDIEMGYEIEPGRYVTFDSDELAELRPSSTRTIDISDFVDLESIDPIFYEKTYWLVPADESAQKAYALLATSMQQQQRVGIGTVVIRTKQYLAAIRPLDGALAMSTMRFADEVVGVEDVEGLPELDEPSERELQLANQIIDGLTADWDPDQYTDSYTEELKALIEQKAAGGDVLEQPDAEPTDSGGQLVDLMAALEASVEAAKAPRGGGARTTSADADSSTSEDETEENRSA